MFRFHSTPFHVLFPSQDSIAELTWSHIGFYLRFRMDSSTKPFHVLIIGGGIAGPALALALNKAKISCAVYEAYSYTNDDVGGGFNIAPNGMYILNQLGVAEELIQRCAPANKAFFRDEAGNELGSFAFGPATMFEFPALSMSRATLYRAMEKEMRQKGIEVHYAKKFSAFQESEEEGGRVSVVFEDGSVAVGSILVGADGVRSTVRSRAFPDAPEPQFTGMLGVGGFVESLENEEIDPAHFNALNFVFGPQGFFGWGGAEDGRIMWWSNWNRQSPLSRDEIANFSEDQLKLELLEKFGSWASPIPQCIRRTTKLLKHNVFDIQSLPKWSHGRTVLIGDAAHAVSPNSGQGASLALEDAIEITNLIISNKFDHRRAFEAFELARRDRCEKIIAEGRKRGSSKGSVHWMVSKVRNWFLTLIFKFAGPASIQQVMHHKIDLLAPSSSSSSANSDLSKEEDQSKQSLESDKEGN